MSLTGIIGGSGLSRLEGLEIVERRQLDTPFGDPSAALTLGRLQGRDIVFLPRHGDGHTLAPHCINYRANIWAMHALGVDAVVALASVGGIGTRFAPGRLAVPDQIIDYTHGREQSFFSEDFSPDRHIDFTWPYDGALRRRLLDAAAGQGMSVIDGGTYGAAQGPRLETAAEIARMARDGCDLVGMTGMPEACLARELALPYATLAVVANWAAGIAGESLSLSEMDATLETAMADACTVLAGFIRSR